ncbi:MAG: hypothetical protein ABFC85_06010 [Rectinema sp.]|jgi:methionyl-tRNA synthetase|uniref:Uncharacterized protein n=1 Tax=uncultured spirochete TaxID=156406 RepID=A0A3P3XR76_9SPIR|nr:hypothetical protein SPIRO4BDMA_50199 [uncultured spirochete]
MNRLTKNIIAHIPNPLFTAKELAVLEPSSDNVRYALVKRAIADGDILIEEDQLSEMTHADFDELEGNYSSRRVLRFLAGLKQEIVP